MRRTVSCVVSSAIIMALPGGSYAQNQQPVMVECRELAGSDNFLGPNETLINGKACRPAGSSLTVNLNNTVSVANAGHKGQPLTETPVSTTAPRKAQPSADGLGDSKANAISDTPAVATVPPSASGVPVSHITLEDGTPVQLVLSENLSSASAVTGQTVAFETVEDIIVDGVVVIPRMSTAWGTVTQAQAKRRMGRGGKLDLNIDKVRLADGEKAMLRAVKETKGGGHTGAMTGAIVATALVVWPAAPLFLLMHGKDTSIPKGTQITAFINGDVKLDKNKFAK
jgi:hypothetical protein